MTTTYSILGCTGCGKAAVGRALAQRIGGQILSVDSMKVYRRMDIGTAKPTRDAQQQVPHFGLDLVEPSETRIVPAADAACAGCQQHPVQTMLGRSQRDLLDIVDIAVTTQIP